MSHIGYFPFGDGAKCKVCFHFCPVPEWKQTETVPETAIKKTHRSGNSEQCVLLYGNGAVSG